MAKGYAVLRLEITDPDKVGEYVKAVTPVTLHKHGAKVLVSGPARPALEGESPHGEVVILEFDSIESAQAWYDDPEYQPHIRTRQAGSTGDVYLLEGFTPRA